MAQATNGSSERAEAAIRAMSWSTVLSLSLINRRLPKALTRRSPSLNCLVWSAKASPSRTLRQEILDASWANTKTSSSMGISREKKSARP